MKKPRITEHDIEGEEEKWRVDNIYKATIVKTVWDCFFSLFSKIFYSFLFLERGETRETEKERNTNV